MKSLLSMENMEWNLEELYQENLFGEYLVKARILDVVWRLILILLIMDTRFGVQ